MKTNKPASKQQSAATFAQYVQAVSRYSPQALVNKYQSELMSFFRCQVSPLGAAVHIYCLHNKGGK